MIVESERHAGKVFDQYFEYQDPLAEPHESVPIKFSKFLVMLQEIRHERTNHKLQDDLIEHLCALKENEQFERHVVNQNLSNLNYFNSYIISMFKILLNYAIQLYIIRKFKIWTY